MSDELILEEFMPYRLARLSSTVSARVAKAYDKEFGLSIPEWRVIAVLGRYPGLSAVEVAEQTFLDKVAVSRAVTKLIRNGPYRPAIRRRRSAALHPEFVGERPRGT